MDDRHSNSVWIVAAMLALLLAVYVGSYFALVVPDGFVGDTKDAYGVHDVGFDYGCLNCFAHLQEVELRECDVSDADLAKLMNLKHIDRIRLSSTVLTADQEALLARQRRDIRLVR